LLLEYDPNEAHKWWTRDNRENFSRHTTKGCKTLKLQLKTQEIGPEPFKRQPVYYLFMPYY
jgi:hypothetical protein